MVVARRLHVVCTRSSARSVVSSLAECTGVFVEPPGAILMRPCARHSVTATRREHGCCCFFSIQAAFIVHSGISRKQGLLQQCIGGLPASWNV